ncbi:glycosyltransferase [Flavobacterium sp.]|uniref:glycosyltransferase n=1 Tax=Flavobacterium sp. TaxID=239 RepID=UPI002EDA2535
MEIENRNVIPKIIHYCWFGKKRKPKLVRDCIKSWKKYLPDYEIIQWNEKNSDLSHPFVKEAYRLEKWAFVSDYIRLKVLYEYGGIYLDTDMMLLKSLNDFLDNECFFGAEQNDIVSCGIIGSIKYNGFIEKCLISYNRVNFNNEIVWNDFIITLKITNILRNEFNFYKDFDQFIQLKNISIYPVNVFYPFPFKYKKDILNYKEYIQKESYAVHLWVGSWIVYNEFKFLRAGEYRKGFTIMYEKGISKNLNFKYFRKILSALKESLKK